MKGGVKDTESFSESGFTKPRQISALLALSVTRGRGMLTSSQWPAGPNKVGTGTPGVKRVSSSGQWGP